MWNAKAHEAKKMCLGVKHILTSGGQCMKLSPMTPKSTPTLVAFEQKSQIFRALVEKANKHQIGPPKYHWKGLELQMPKVPSHY